MSSANRAFIEISPYSLQLAIVAGRHLVAKGDYPLDAKEAIATLLATHQAQAGGVVLVSSKQSFARIAGDGSGAGRTEADLLAAAEASPGGLTPPLSVVACDAVTGKPFDPALPGSLLLSGVTAESLAAVRDQLAGLGLTAPVRTGLALPAQLGAVVSALQDVSESTRVAVLALGENDSALALVSAGGVEVVQPVAVGYGQIFEAVKAELGLRFRAAATKLFFNAVYDFSDTADKIGARLAAPLQAALESFPIRPTALLVVGLPDKQGWFGRSLAQGLGLTHWAPDMAKLCAQLELQAAAGSEPTANALSLVQLAASADACQAGWLPGFLGEKPAPASAVVPAPLPAPAPIPQAAPKPMMTRAPFPAAPTAPRVAAPLPRPISPVPPPSKLPPKPLQAPVAAPTVKPAVVLPRPQPPAPPAPPVPPPAIIPVAEAEPVPARAPEPVVMAAAEPVAPLPAGPKRRIALYAVLGLALLVAIGVGVGGKLSKDSAKKAEALALQQAADEAHKLAVEKAEAALKLNPATGLPGSWLKTDIGHVFAAGSAGFKQGEFTLSGYGSDIGTFKDGFQFTYVPLAGDGAITARMVTLSGATRVAKVGLMVRGALSENSAHVSLQLQNQGKNLKVVWRAKTGATTAIVDASGKAAVSLPNWLRLVRAGTTVTAYQSDDGSTWNVVAGTPVTVTLPDNVYVGLAVCARGNTPVVTTVDHVSVPGWDSAPAILAGAAR